MPELVEVETATRMVNAHCAGKRISEVVVLEQGGGPRDGTVDDKVLTAPDELKAVMEGRKLVCMNRKGKYMWWTLDKPPHPTFHFAMSGSFKIEGVKGMKYVREKDVAATWPPRYCKLEVVFTDGTKLAFCNSRRLGRVGLLDDPESVPPVSKLGFDALADDFTPDNVHAALSTRSVPLKAALLDQSVFAGVGNWIADEALYQAKLHPLTPCDRLSAAQVSTLVRVVKAIVTTAVASPDSSTWPKDWLFHYRWSKKAAGTKDGLGNTIKFLTVGGRTTALVEKVQGRRSSAPASGGKRGTAPLDGGDVSAGAGAGAGAAASPTTTTTKPRRGTKSIPSPAGTRGRRTVPSPPSTAKRRRRAQPSVSPAPVAAAVDGDVDAPTSPVVYPRLPRTRSVVRAEMLEASAVDKALKARAAVRVRGKSTRTTAARRLK